MLAPARASVTPERDSFALFPMATEGWSGRRQLLEPEVEASSAPTTISAAFYSPGARRRGSISSSAYYHKPDRSGARSTRPRSACRPAAGRCSASSPPTIDLPGTRSSGPVRLNRAVIQKGLERQLVYYWFEGRGRHMTNDFAAKFYALSDSLTRGRTDGGLVRLITPIGTEEAEDAADARLQQFLQAHIDALPRFIPE